MENFDFDAARKRLMEDDISVRDVITASMNAAAGTFVLVGTFVAKILNHAEGREVFDEELVGQSFAEAYEQMFLVSLVKELDGEQGTAEAATDGTSEGSA